VGIEHENGVESWLMRTHARGGPSATGGRSPDPLEDEAPPWPPPASRGRSAAGARALRDRQRSREPARRRGPRSRRRSVRALKSSSPSGSRAGVDCANSCSRTPSTRGPAPRRPR
jgi:hypothetical protein